MHKGFVFLVLAVVLIGCSSERKASVSWEGDKIRVAIVPPGGSTLFSPPSADCLTCSEVLPPIPLSEDANGVAYFKLDEAATSIATHFHVKASGLDTALTLQPRSPNEESQYYHLALPVIGRIMSSGFSHIYLDSTMSKTVGTLGRGDEANLFRESDVFYYIHHPSYDHPVVVLRQDAIRLK